MNIKALFAVTAMALAVSGCSKVYDQLYGPDATKAEMTLANMKALTVVCGTYADAAEALATNIRLKVIDNETSERRIGVANGIIKPICGSSNEGMTLEPGAALKLVEAHLAVMLEEVSKVQ
jgi:hypothetical protein